MKINENMFTMYYKKDKIVLNSVPIHWTTFQRNSIKSWIASSNIYLTKSPLELLTLACFSEQMMPNCLSEFCSVEDVGDIPAFILDTDCCPVNIIITRIFKSLKKLETTTSNIILPHCVFICTCT